MEVLQKVTTNVELLRHILKFLTLKEQIQMISVCKEFEDIIENFIWKWKFKDIKTIETDDSSDFTFSDAANNVYNLTESECQTFFTIMAKHIRKLIIRNRNKDKLTDFYKFENLIMLEFYGAIVTVKNFKSLAINCPKLETIHFQYSNDETFNNPRSCCNASGITLSKPGQLESLAKVKSLKNLELTIHNWLYTSLLGNIFNQLCLTSLNIDACLCKSREEVKAVNLKNCQALEHLSLEFASKVYFEFEKTYLKNLVNLTTLTLTGYHIILRDSNLVTLATTCNKLQELSFFQVGIQIKQFPKQFKLKKLTLKYCKYLTWENLQQILQELKLEEFITEHTKYEGSCDLSYANCAIANTLNVLDIKTKEDQEFLKFIKYINNNKPVNLITFRYEFNNNVHCLKI